MSDQAISADDERTASARQEPHAVAHDGSSRSPSQGDGDSTDDAASHESPEQSQPVPEALPLDQRFEILKNQRRRYVLQYLYEADEQASLSDLAEQIAAWENDKEVQQISSSERKRVYVGLYQCHLPKMDSMGIVSYNKPRGTIEKGEHIDCFRSYLETGDDDTDTDGPLYNPYYVAVPMVGITLLPVVVWLQTDSTPLLLGTVLVVFVLTVVAVQHLTSTYADDNVSVDGTPTQ